MVKSESGMAEAIRESDLAKKRGVKTWPLVIKVEKESEARFLEAVKKYGSLAFHFTKFSKKSGIPVSSAFEAWHRLLEKKRVEAALIIDGSVFFKHNIMQSKYSRGERNVK